MKLDAAGPLRFQKGNWLPLSRFAVRLLDDK
jgi:hypothetical protein